MAVKADFQCFCSGGATTGGCVIMQDEARVGIKKSRLDLITASSTRLVTLQANS
jgi:hypothetical protein